MWGKWKLEICESEAYMSLRSGVAEACRRGDEVTALADAVRHTYRTDG